MFSREKTQDIPSNPQVTAEVLKQRLQGIQRTLKSKKTSPAMALSAMAELIALQDQVHRVLASLKVGSLLRLQQKTVTTSEPVSHLAASKFSPLFDTDCGKLDAGRICATKILSHEIEVGSKRAAVPAADDRFAADA
jgi:hypothetical protein